MNFTIIKSNFERGLWNEKQLKIAFEKGFITQDEYTKILKLKKD